MLNKINKIIRSIGKKYILLFIMLITTAIISCNINAIGLNDGIVAIDAPNPKLSTDSQFIYTYKPPGDNGDYVTLIYKPGSGISYKGRVTLTNGCQSLTQSSLNTINYFVAPGPNDPILSFNLNVNQSGDICTLAVQLKEFSGELKGIDFGELQAPVFHKFITFNWTKTDSPLPPVDNTNYNKLKWEESNYDYIASNNYRFFLKSNYSRTQPAKGQCISIITFYGGFSCKTVEVHNYQKRNRVVTVAKDAITLRKYFGVVNTFGKAHFIADALRTQLWDRGEAKVKNNYYIRVNNECTKDATYYELVSTPTTYDIKFIKKVVGGYDGPALCT